VLALGKGTRHDRSSDRRLCAVFALERGRHMLRRLLIVLGVAFGVAACTSQQQAVAPAPPPEKAWLVFFDFGSATLSPDARATLAQASAIAKSMPNSTVRVTGFTDTVGTEAANVALAQQRASAARDALIANGVNAATVTIVGAGEAGLLVITPDQTKEARNRRVQVLVR
jgi:outer membrane protein OmpA-like peptidoglycan-associated protein